MEIIYHKQVTEIDLPQNATAEIHLFCVQIEAINQHAKDLISILHDKSWIGELEPIAKMTYEQTAERTIEKLIEIFSGIDSIIRSDFGEYMISMSAGNCLGEKLNHLVLPLSEIWKEKVLGNHGFDFHSKSPNEKIAFGEAKYNSRDNSYREAAKQIIEFILDGKDRGDGVHLKNFVSLEAIQNLVKNKKGFSVAFSLHSSNHEQILHNALNSDIIANLSSQCDELYIIGVKA
jgi:hypothetical protein